MSPTADKVKSIEHVPLFLPVATAIIGFFVALWAGTFFAPTGDDTSDYVRLAQNVVQGNGLSLSWESPHRPSASRAPTYPIFLSFVYAFAGESRTAVLVVQSLVMAIGCALLTRLTMVMFHRRVALLTILLYAMNPYFGRWAGSVLTEALYLTLIIACVHAFVVACKSGRSGWFVVTGLLWAVTVMCRPLTFALLPLMLFGIWIAPLLAGRFRSALILIAVGLLGLAPWTIRNWNAFHAFIPLQTQAFGSNFWLTTLPLEDQPTVSWEGYSEKWRAKYPEVRTQQSIGPKDTLQQRDSERELISAGLQRVAADPLGYAISRFKIWPRLFIHGGGLWFNGIALRTAWNEGWYGVVVAKLFLFFFLSLLPFVLGGVGLLLFRRDWRRLYPLMMVPILIGLVHLPLWIEDRYGMPAMPFILVFAAAAVVRLGGVTDQYPFLRNFTNVPVPKTISVVIPAKNEGQVIVDVATATQPFCDELIIVDGRSTDGSPERLKALGIKVIPDRGLGKGDGLRCGLEAATGDIVVFMDADGSHDPADIPALVRSVQANEADMVVGCRMRGGSDEFAGTWELFIRLWGNNFLTMVLNTRYGATLTDTQNGFRAARRTVLNDLQLKENKHTIELEMIMQALRRGYRVTQVPSHEYCRREGQSSLSVRKQAYAFLRCLIVNLW